MDVDSLASISGRRGAGNDRFCHDRSQRSPLVWLAVGIVAPSGLYLGVFYFLGRGHGFERAHDFAVDVALRSQPLSRSSGSAATGLRQERILRLSAKTKAPAGCISLELFLSESKSGAGRRVHDQLETFSALDVDVTLFDFDDAFFHEFGKSATHRLQLHAEIAANFFAGHP